MSRLSIFFFMTLIFLVLFKQMSGEVNTMKEEDKDPYKEQRLAMVENQIIARGVKDTLVLQAMKKVERHHFVPENLRHLAYADEPLPIGSNQTISQPYIVAYMTEALNLKSGEKILEIGTGSGYQAAVLAEISDSIFTIEIIEKLARQAKKKIKELGYNQILCRTGDGYQGWPEEAPFDCIIVTAAPPHIPETLIDQLKDGGRMIVPVGEWFQELVLISKINEKIEEKKLIPVRFVPMTGEIQKKRGRKIKK
jgi:protein-L-isoaspartate(D-aspartate) O-methyltransferase